MKLSPIQTAGAACGRRVLARQRLTLTRSATLPLCCTTGSRHPDGDQFSSSAGCSRSEFVCVSYSNISCLWLHSADHQPVILSVQVHPLGSLHR